MAIERPDAAAGAVLMSDFRKLSESFLASPQLTLEDVAIADAAGVRMIINNRPEGEAADQIPGAMIEAAARAAGIDYVSIPISPGDFSQANVQAMVDALDQANAKVLAYCRTGTRSTLLWALAQSALGVPPQSIADAAGAAGYDVSPIWPVIAAVANSARH
jgi:uncharacterized protein (TIGR01244 family)